MVLVDAPTFIIKGSNGRKYRKFVKRLRCTWGMRFRGDIWTLRKVPVDKVFPLRLVGEHRDLLILFRQQDVYKIAWEKKEQSSKGKGKEKFRSKEDKVKEKVLLPLYIFQDVLEDLKEFSRENVSEPLFDSLINAEDINIKSSYADLARHAGNLKKIPVGRRALLDAVDYLSQLESKSEEVDPFQHRHNITKHCWVIIQMISESLRFENLLDLITTKYKEGTLVDEDLLKMEKNWSSITKNLKDFWFRPWKLCTSQKEECKNLRLVLWKNVEDIDKDKML